MALPPLVRARKDERASVAITHLGAALCVHEGIVHGETMATLLDESLDGAYLILLWHGAYTDSLLAMAGLA